MKIALVGPPGAGKSTLFSYLTGQEYTKVVQSSGRALEGVVPVPDERLDLLVEHEGPTEKVTYGTVTFVDSPDLVLEGPGRSGNTGAVSHLREADGMIMVLPGHISGSDAAGMAKVAEQIRSELYVSDLDIAEKRIEKLEAQVKRPVQDKDRLQGELDLLKKLLPDIESGNRAAFADLSSEQLKWIRGYCFFSQKPMIWLINAPETDLDRAQEVLGALDLDPAFFTSVKFELDLNELDEEERAAFMEDYGITTTVKDSLLKAAYNILRLQSFFTYGPDEMRAWTIELGDLAPVAAGKIHSDIERGFIAAEVVGFDDWIAAGHDLKAVKAAGKFRQEGKQYVVNDGDLITFKFNV